MESTQERLKKCIQRVGMKKPPKDLVKAFHTVVWELMKANTRINILEKSMDKKMTKVTKQMKTAERDVKAKKPAAAVKALKGAEKKNIKLTKIDREVRDPDIKAYKKMKKKGC